MRNCTLAVEMLRMFKYVMENSLAQSIVIDLFKAPLSSSVLQQVKKHVFDEMECRGSKVSQLLEVAIAVEDGSYDAWKLPVTVVGALLAATFVMTLVFLGFIKYLENRTVLRNGFIIDSLGADQSTTQSVASMKALSVTSTDFSCDDTVELTARQLALDESVVRHSSEYLIVRKLCQHFRMDLLNWSTKVLLVRLKDKIAHTNLVKFVGITFHEELWKVVNPIQAKGDY
jgi:hypothetical protein